MNHLYNFSKINCASDLHNYVFLDRNILSLTIIRSNVTARRYTQEVGTTSFSKGNDITRITRLTVSNTLGFDTYQEIMVQAKPITI